MKYSKVFGSRCYIKKLDEKLGKFDDRSDEVSSLVMPPPRKHIDVTSQTA